MQFEHLIYSTAIAIILGMIHFKKTGRDYSWIIIASAFVPDLDIFAAYIFKQFDIGVFINGVLLKHGDFHNITVLFLFAVFVSLSLGAFGMKFADSFIFAGIGFGAHMFEDALVHNPGYAFLWPFSTHAFGLGLVDYKLDLYGIANTEVLIVGLIGLMSCLTIRMMNERDGRFNRTMKTFSIVGIILGVIMASFGVYDNGLQEEIRAGNIVDNWKFTQNASWDSRISHDGSHSARIRISGNESKISGVWQSNRIYVKPNTSYTFSSWGKTQGAGGNYSPAVRLVELNANGKKTNQTNIFFSKGTHNWIQKQTIFTTQNNTIWIYVYGNIWKGYGTFWFDDVGLYEEGIEQNIITNSGFENGIKHIINFKI